MNFNQTLQDLCGLVGISGRETDPRDYVLQRLNGLADEIVCDSRGNVLATRRGQSADRLMLDAHLDEIGFMVTYIEENGFLRFAPVGGWDLRLLPGSRVLLRRGPHDYLPGVLGALPPHVTRSEDRSAAIPLEQLTVDIGASSPDEVREAGIEVGTAMVVDAGFSELCHQRTCARALDDRLGCTILLHLLEELREEKLPWTVTVCFSTAEERGAAAAANAAYALQPDAAICLETTTATDLPGVPPQDIVTALGRGPALTLADGCVIVPEHLIAGLRTIADTNNITYQLKKPLVGGTNAPWIERSGAGIPTAILSVPARNIHSAVSVIDNNDACAALRWLTAVARDPGVLALKR